MTLIYQQNRPDRTLALSFGRPIRNRQTRSIGLVLLVGGCYKIADVDRLEKVSESCQELRSRGLLEADEASRVALLSALLPTLEQPASTGEAWAAEESLVKAFGLKRRVVRSHMRRLRSKGFPIGCRGGTEYGLIRPFDHLLLPEAVLSLLLPEIELDRAWTVGLPYRYLVRCTSTNEVLKEQAERAPAGTVVVTDEQTQGRGRLGRSWLSGAGEDLTFSTLLRPPSAARAPLLSLAAALAVAEVLEEVVGLAGRVQVKWPNDVYVGEKKVCGILLESSVAGDSMKWAIAGIGLNVNSDPCAAIRGLSKLDNEEWRGKAEPTSLRLEVGREVARGALLARLLTRLTRHWFEPRTEALLEGLRTRDRLRGRRVEVLAGPPGNRVIAAGDAAGIGSEGQLLVQDDGGVTLSVFGGEVTVRSRP